MTPCRINGSYELAVLIERYVELAEKLPEPDEHGESIVYAKQLLADFDRQVKENSK